ncbi:thioredoxin domain-containing protein [Saccharothrix violaceirubra]|uniref:Protein-disulfide isomerase n=1 Tax=Saccharothrix violaceirubra TaxID=413306 RepID=A0A7W7WY60_9PSEU|nr:thioredoxin domain-containing protein [Saccharothrix violaceirubra]MBB4968194.1 protein-disulfide isomerase [Saccharothrix violaceirubra]
MGGAERSARKKKQATRAVVAARSGGDRNKVVLGIAVVVVLALVVIVGVIWSKSSSSDEGPTADGISGISAPIARDAGVVVVGPESAKVTIDVYEDFLCPVCGRFKKEYGERIKTEIEAGTLRVRYHVLPLLVKFSSPEGYSKDAANAALCAVDENKFWEFHESLFRTQPEEGGPGYTKERLVKLGTDLGITGDTFKQCVEGGKYDAVTQTEMDTTRALPYFKGTPTVAKDGQVVSLDGDWLGNLVK